MRGTSLVRRARPGLLVAMLIAGLLAGARNVAANTPIMVNRTEDVHDANPGDGVCETSTGSGLCTLRAAIEEAEALAGADAITFDPDLPNPSTFLLSLGHLEISTDLTITGNGSGSTIIDGDGSVTNDRAFLLTTGAAAFSVSISGVTIQNGKPSTGSGGGISMFVISAHLFLSDVTLASNSVLGDGGGLALTGIATLDHCTVSVNTAGTVGGGIYNNGVITVTSSTIAGNSAQRGGGLYNDLTAKLVGSTVIANYSAIDGGGLYANGSLEVANTTVTSNQSGQNGAGIYVKGGPIILRANNATIASNFCNPTFTGCGIYVAAGGGTSITNTVLAQNYHGSKKTGNVPDDCNAVTSGDYNLIQTTAGCSITGATSNNIYNTDPNLGPLLDNGGPTQTLALLAGSPAIDAGNPSGCTQPNSGLLLTTDQRGFVRPVNGRCDMGAYEYAPPVQFYTVTPCRAVDTRNSDAPPLAAGADRELSLVGKCLIPSGARAVSVNVTVVSGTSLGDVRIFPAGTALPLVSTINFAKGQTRANNAITSLSGSGVVAIHDDQKVGNSVQIILDVNGYFQ